MSENKKESQSEKQEEKGGKVKKRWVNIYNSPDSDRYISDEDYDSYQEAYDGRFDGKAYVETVQIVSPLVSEKQPSEVKEGDKNYLSVLRENLEAAKRHQDKRVRKLLTETYEDLILIWEANYAGKIVHPEVKEKSGEGNVEQGWVSVEEYEQLRQLLWHIHTTPYDEKTIRQLISEVFAPKESRENS